MSNLSQQLGQSVSDSINTLNAKITDLENREVNVTPTLTYTDAELFQYGIDIVKVGTLQLQANNAVTIYTLSASDSAAIAALQTRLTDVQDIYITAMVARAPDLFS